jgi:hypothetical protein
MLARALLGLVVATVAGCTGSDEDAALQGPVNAPLAVGAYHGLSVSDACAGGGKLNFCSTERLVSVDSLVSRDPSIAEIVLPADVPREISEDPYFVRGVGPGTAVLEFSATFDDGTTRTGTLDLEVRRANAAHIVAGCGIDESDVVLAMPGETRSFEVRLFDGRTVLSGWHPDALESVAGVTPWYLSDESNHFEWTAPTQPVRIGVTSPVVGRSAGTLRAFAPSEVTDVVVTSPNSAPLATSIGEAFYVDTKMTVDGVTVCNSQPGFLRTETPAVCSGPSGSQIWAAESHSRGSAVVNAEGICRLRASADGTTFFGVASFELFVVTAPASAEYAGFGNPCSVEGSSTCTYGFSSVAVCRDGFWSGSESDYCGPDRVCDFQDVSASGCVAGSTCAHCRGLR